MKKIVLLTVCCLTLLAGCKENGNGDGDMYSSAGPASDGPMSTAHDGSMEAGAAAADSQSIYSLIRQDHQMVMQLFERLQSQGTDPEARLAVLRELQKALLPHMQGEEQLFYPAVAQREAQLAAQAANEHAQARDLLQKLMAQPEQEGFTEQANQLKNMITQHVQLEEGRLFQVARQQLSADQAISMGQQFQQMKLQFLQQQFPPSSARETLEPQSPGAQKSWDTKSL